MSAYSIIKNNFFPLTFLLHDIICYLILSTDPCTIYGAHNLSVFPCVLFLQMCLIFRNTAPLRYTTSDVTCILTFTETNVEACLSYVSHSRHTSLTGVGSREWCSAHTRWSWLIVSSIRRFTAHCNPPSTVLMLMRVWDGELSAHRALPHLHMNLTDSLDHPKLWVLHLVWVKWPTFLVFYF